MAVAGQNTRRPPGGQKIIVNQSKPILVTASMNPFTCQSFRQNYFSREIEWAVCTRQPLKSHLSDFNPLEM